VSVAIARAANKQILNDSVIQIESLAGSASGSKSEVQEEEAS
jgi:hypothetical protein